MADEDKDSKTEEATPRKLEEARAERDRELREAGEREQARPAHPTNSAGQQAAKQATPDPKVKPGDAQQMQETELTVGKALHGGCGLTLAQE